LDQLIAHRGVKRQMQAVETDVERHFDAAGTVGSTSSSMILRRAMVSAIIERD